MFHLIVEVGGRPQNRSDVHQEISLYVVVQMGGLDP